MGTELAAILGLALLCMAWYGVQVATGAMRDKPLASGGPKVIEPSGPAGGCGSCSVEGCESRAD